MQNAKKYNNNEVQLAMQAYEMVDKHTQWLDADLAQSEDYLKQILAIFRFWKFKSVHLKWLKLRNSDLKNNLKDRDFESSL